MTPKQELVQLFGAKDRELDALRGLAGGVTATHLRTASLGDEGFNAIVEGLSERSSRVRWWCIQVLDHMPDVRAASAIATALDHPIARVRRNAAGALGCIACKPGWEGELPNDALQRLRDLVAHDPNETVRRQMCQGWRRCTSPVKPL